MAIPPDTNSLYDGVSRENTVKALGGPWPKETKSIYEDVGPKNMARALADYAAPLPFYDWVNSGARFLEQGVKAPLNALQRNANERRVAMGMEPKPLMEITTPKPRDSVQFGPAVQSDVVLSALLDPRKIEGMPVPTKTAPPPQQNQPQGRLGPIYDAPANRGVKGAILTPQQLGDKYYAGVKQALADAQSVNDNAGRANSSSAKKLIDFIDALSMAGLGPSMAKQGVQPFINYATNDENNARAVDVANAQKTGKDTPRWGVAEKLLTGAAAAGGDPMVVDQVATMLGYEPGTPLQFMMQMEQEFAQNPDDAARRARMQEILTAIREGEPVIEGKADGGEIGSTINPTAVGAPADLDTGDYVIPADVLRFYGSKFFTTLIEKADSD